MAASVEKGGAEPPRLLLATIPVLWHWWRLYWPHDLRPSPWGHPGAGTRASGLATIQKWSGFGLLSPAQPLASACSLGDYSFCFQIADESSELSRERTTCRSASRAALEQGVGGDEGTSSPPQLLLRTRLYHPVILRNSLMATIPGVKALKRLLVNQWPNDNKQYFHCKHCKDGMWWWNSGTEYSWKRQSKEIYIEIRGFLNQLWTPLGTTDLHPQPVLWPGGRLRPLLSWMSPL